MSATKAYILHPELKGADSRRSSEAKLGEAIALAEALPATEITGAEIIRLDQPHPGWLFGSGKRAMLKEQIIAAEAQLVLIDGPVTPVQQRNLEKEWGVKLLDRTGLILEIFSDRAATREGVLQVEMAALAYQRTRLVRAWTHLERQRGGLGFVGGPGETQIEADRRAIDEALIRLRRKLDKVSKTRHLHREARARIPYPIIGLVGYTNAGKSTLFNRMSGADVMAKDMLFATLDPTMRAIKLKGAGEIILSDTVGFVSDLPTELVAAFRATLDEVRSADIILHVRDISHPHTDAQKTDVEAVMAELELSEDIPVLEIWNKSDQLPLLERKEFQAQSQNRPDVVLASALTGEGLEQLGRMIGDHLAAGSRMSEINLPYEESEARAFAYREGLVQSEHEEEDGYRLQLRWDERQEARFKAMLLKQE